jgi:hypothetical protein
MENQGSLKKSILNYNPILNKYKTYKKNESKQDRIEEAMDIS